MECSPFQRDEQLTFNWNDNVKLPIGFGLTVVPKGLRDYCKDVDYAMNNVLLEENRNLTNLQKELLKWHSKLIHINMGWLQSLIKPCGDVDPIIMTKYKGTLKCEKPRCASCMISKAHRLPTGTTRTRQLNPGGIKQEYTMPGQLVHTDQYVSQLKGRLQHTYGKEKSKDMFMGGTVFIDNASSFAFISNQVSSNAAETIKGKHQFEREARRHGVVVQQYRGDNGVITRHRHSRRTSN